MRQHTTFVASIAPIALVCSIAAPALAWNDYGHQLSAYLAYKGMTPEARAVANWLLRQHPQYNMLIEHCPEGFDKDLYAFMRAATWPDMLRSESNPLHKTDHHGPWHYVDYPINRDDAKGPIPVELWMPGSDPENVLQALQKCEADLRNPSITDADKAKMLCWYLHLMGDLHQPLHTTGVFTKALPEGDRGGNLFIINDAGHIQRLHAFWDNILGVDKDAKNIAARGAQIQASPALSRESLKSDLAHTTSIAWAKDGHELAKSVVYADGKLPGTEVQPDAPLPKAVPELAKEYRENGTKVAEKQIALAGFRMTDGLNTLLGPPAEKAK